jgi:hypothetical protein
MQVENCRKDSDLYTLTWEQVQHQEGIYRQTGNKEGHVIVLVSDAFSPRLWGAFWLCGSSLYAYAGPSDSATRFRPDRGVKLCIEVR